MAVSWILGSTGLESHMVAPPSGVALIQTSDDFFNGALNAARVGFGKHLESRRVVAEIVLGRGSDQNRAFLVEHCPSALLSPHISGLVDVCTFRDSLHCHAARSSSRSATTWISASVTPGRTTARISPASS